MPQEQTPRVIDSISNITISYFTFIIQFIHLHGKHALEESKGEKIIVIFNI